MTLSRSKEKLVARLRNRRTRVREGLVLVEGIRAAQDVLEGDAEVRFAVMDPSLEVTPDGRELARRIGAAGIPVQRVDESELDDLSDTESPQGILLVCAEPRFEPGELLATPGGRFLVLDAIQDPGNLGTLVRAARAFALDGVVALDGTVDPWNPKAVRAAAGSSFRIPLLKESWGRIGPILEEQGVRMLIAEAGGSDVAGAVAVPPWALVVGSEADGPRTAVRAQGEAVVTVPMPGGTESLNAGVAGAILLYVLSGASGRPRP